jgi:hypothetical protein
LFKDLAEINSKEKDKTTLQNRLGDYLAGFGKFRGRITSFVVWGVM